MIEPDTVKLLRECDAGVKMGISSIEDVEDRVRSHILRAELEQFRADHQQLAAEISAQLHRCRDDGKNPNPIAKGMSWVKTNVMLSVNESDHTIADLITDGCNMGVKSLNRYLNKYGAADEVSKEITKRLINQEEELTQNVRRFL